MPPDVHALAERLKRDYERFSPAQQSLARYLADHLADVPLLSAHEVARASHCSPATVVRFAQALGYSGYPEMQRTVRRAQRPGLPPRPGDRQLGLPLSADGIESALAAERLALDDLSERLGAAGLGSMAAAIGARAPLVIAGEGHARTVVTLIEERLARAGRPVAAVTSLDPAARAWLDGIGPGGAVLAIAIGRESRVAQAAVSAGRAAGVPAAALVDSSLSPLARNPLARVVPADARDGQPTLVAMVAVAQALAAALAPPRREMARTRPDLAAVGA
ncbi:MAG TPA: MurR/RpiR family transcriptional regulator [Miltoncostaeaceae bacterium]|nr:MurR/RpiR family transcriptional regulator [Miltoncostaeaceae bacterium]